MVLPRERRRGTRALACLALMGGIGPFAGCAAPDLHMMPTPVLYKDERLDFMPHVLPELRSTQLPVFYATNRAPAASGKPGHYTDRESDTVRLGVADVVLGAPGWAWEDLAASDRTSTIEHPRPARVERVEELGTLRGEDMLSEGDEFSSPLKMGYERNRCFGSS